MSEVKRYLSTRALPDSGNWNSSCVPHTYVRATDYDALHAEAEALRVALHEIASVNPAQRGIEWAKSYASDGLNGAGSELYARWLDTFKEAEALRAENGRLQADRDRASQYANQQALECNKLSTDLEAARGLLREAQEAYAEAIHWEDQQPVMKKIAAFLNATSAPEARQADQRWSSFDEWLAWELDQGDGTMAAASDSETRLARRLWFCLERAPLAEQGERQEAFVWMRPDGDESFELTSEGDYLSFPLYKAQQPSPDVLALVEALEGCLELIETICPFEGDEVRKARAALSTHQDT